MKKVSYVCLYSFSLLLAALPLQQMMGGQVNKVEGLTVQSVQQQGRKITGQVVDDKTGDPLIGVNVKVKGTTMGTITDLDGRFTLTVTTKNPVIVVSYIGYSQQELTASGNQLNIKLKEDAMALDEVVVVGYGVQKKSLVTGAIASVKGSELEMTGIMRADDALQGKTPGVQIISNSGQPGTSTSIRIRGVGTNGTAQPIYIVDGMAVGDIEYLNPADIESIEVLKDAASSAIYGARGGNGVILVTTKKGE